MKLLIGNGANVNAVNEYNNSALIVAALNGKKIQTNLYCIELKS